MQVTITKTNRKERVSNKTGKTFISLGLMTDKHGERWLSGFENETTKDWKVGDVVDIEIQTKGEYLNFTTARKDSTPVPANPGMAEIKNMLTFKVIPLLQQIIDSLPKKEGYPAMDSSNDAHFPDIEVL